MLTHFPFLLYNLVEISLCGVLHDYVYVVIVVEDIEYLDDVLVFQIL